MHDWFYRYLAGIVDGDGTIAIRAKAKRKKHVVTLEVYNTNYLLIQLLQKQIQGNIRKRVYYDDDKRLWKPIFIWKLEYRKASTAIKHIYPFLLVKKRQATLALRLSHLKEKYRGAHCYKSSEGKKLYARVNKLYSLIKDRCTKINKRGTISNSYNTENSS